MQNVGAVSNNNLDTTMRTHTDKSNGAILINIMQAKLRALRVPDNVDCIYIHTNVACELSDDHINAAELAVEEEADSCETTQPLGDRLMSMRRKAIENGDVELKTTDEIIEEVQKRRGGETVSYDGDTYYELREEDILEIPVAECCEENPQVALMLAELLPNLQYIGDSKFVQNVFNAQAACEVHEVQLDTLYAVDGLMVRVPKSEAFTARAGVWGSTLSLMTALQYAVDAYERYGVVMLPGTESYSVRNTAVIYSLNRYTPEAGPAELADAFAALLAKLDDGTTSEAMCFYPLTRSVGGGYRATYEVYANCSSR